MYSKVISLAGAVYYFMKELMQLMLILSYSKCVTTLSPTEKHFCKRESPMGIFLNVTAATECPTILDHQSHVFATFKLERLIPGLNCCISFHWLNLIMACSFMFISLKAVGKWTKSSPTTFAIALIKVILSEIIKH